MRRSTKIFSRFLAMALLMIRGRLVGGGWRGGESHLHCCQTFSKNGSNCLWGCNLCSHWSVIYIWPMIYTYNRARANSPPHRDPPTGILSPETCKANASLVLSFLLPLLIFSTVLPAFDSAHMDSILCVVVTGVFYQGLHSIFSLLWRSKKLKT